MSSVETPPLTCLTVTPSRASGTPTTAHHAGTYPLLGSIIIDQMRHERENAMSTTSTAVLFGIDYRDPNGALAHIQAADIKSFQEGKSFVAEYIGGAAGQDKAALTAADASALEPVFSWGFPNQ
jgi:hypothetical protein